MPSFSFPILPLLQDACCWSCVPCREDSVVIGEDQCYQCPIGYSPSPEKDQCLAMEAESLDGQSPWVFFPLLLSSLGIVVTLEVVVVFIFYNRTSIIMASGRELSYVLLGGIFSSYACSFVTLSEPGLVNCTRELFVVLFAYLARFSKSSASPFSRFARRGRK